MYFLDRFYKDLNKMKKKDVYNAVVNPYQCFNLIEFKFDNVKGTVNEISETTCKYIKNTNCLYVKDKKNIYNFYENKIYNIKKEYKEFISYLIKKYKNEISAMFYKKDDVSHKSIHLFVLLNNGESFRFILVEN